MQVVEPGEVLPVWLCVYARLEEELEDLVGWSIYRCPHLAQGAASILNNRSGPLRWSIITQKNGGSKE